MSGVQTVCGSCGSAVRVGAAFCPRCGAAQRSVAVAGAGDMPGQRPPVPGAVGMQLAGREIASPGLRVVSWLVELVALGLVSFVIGLLVTVLASSALVGGMDFTTWMIMVTWVPIVALLAWLIGVLVWEARTGNRIGNAVTRVRTVNATTGGPPGVAKVLGSRLVLGLFSALGYAIVVAIRQSAGGLGAAEAWLPMLIQGGLTLVAVGSGTWGAPPLRQGWHERASGTTAVRAGTAARPGLASTTSPGEQTNGLVTGSGGTYVTAAPVMPLLPAPLQMPAMPSAPGAPHPQPTVPAPAGGQPAPVAHVSPPVPVPMPTPDGMIAVVPGFASSAPQAPQAPAPAAPSAASPAAPSYRSPGVLPPAAPSADEADEIEHTRISRRDRRTLSSHRLSFDTGEVVDVTGPGLVGRAPEPAAGEVVEHLVPIADPDRSVSKTHLAFGLNLDGVWVADRESTNGTRVVTQGRAPIEVGQAPIPVADGSVVQFGERSFTVRKA